MRKSFRTGRSARASSNDAKRSAPRPRIVSNGAEPAYCRARAATSGPESRDSGTGRGSGTRAAVRWHRRYRRPRPPSRTRRCRNSAPIALANGSLLDDFVFVGHARPARTGSSGRPQWTDVAGHDDKTAVRHRLLRPRPERRRARHAPAGPWRRAPSPRTTSESGGEEIAGPFEVAREEEEIEREERAKRTKERAAASEHEVRHVYDSCTARP